MTNLYYNTACGKLQLQILKKIDEITAWKDSNLHKLLQLSAGDSLNAGTQQFHGKIRHMLGRLLTSAL